MRSLTKGQRRAFTLATVLVAAGMCIGLLSSFTTLYAAALAHHWAFPAGLPLAVDLGIPAYVILDHLAVTLGERSPMLRCAAWALAGFTVWANAAVFAGGGLTWRVIHAAMPALWVLGTEGLRQMWALLREDPETRARARALTVARADVRAHVRDILHAELGRRWRKDAPLLLRRQLRSGRLPAPVLAAIESGLTYGGASVWEPAAQSWVTSELTYGEKVKASLTQARRAIVTASETPELPSSGASEPRQPVRQKTASDRARKRAKAERLVTANPRVPVAEMMEKCGISKRTAERWRGEMTRQQAEAARWKAAVVLEDTGEMAGVSTNGSGPGHG
jgi:hypothetical protein